MGKDDNELKGDKDVIEEQEEDEKEEFALSQPDQLDSGKVLRTVDVVLNDLFKYVSQRYHV